MGYLPVINIIKIAVAQIVRARRDKSALMFSVHPGMAHD
jgi:hypothetical protein